MNRVLIITGILVLILGGCGVSKYNTLAEYKGNVDAAWSQVQNQFQRRADLIPNLVETVKGYKDFEQETLAGITAARARVGQLNIQADDLSNPEKMQEFIQAQQSLGSSLSRLLVVSENYPDLKSNTVFQNLMAQLEGTENRIATERKRYIDATRTYNVFLSQFPNNLYGGMFGYDKVVNFEAAAGSEQAPDVNFN